MKLNRRLIASLALIALIVAVAVVACATPAIAPNARPAAQPAAQSNPQANAQPANNQPGAKTGSLLDAPLNRTKFPNASLTTNVKETTVGKPFKIQGSGFPAATKLDLVWGGLDGSFKLGDQMEFVNFQFAEEAVPIASVVADPNGQIAYDFVVPEDFGGVHNIYALSGGEKVMQAGLTVRSDYVVSPLSGPVGTPISIKITGIGYAKWDEARAIAYDNQFTGFVNATLTRGTATATLRATGGVGKHVIRIGTWMIPYLNIDQAPNYAPGLVQEIVFNVTGTQPDAKSTEIQTEWPARNYADLAANPGLVGAHGERLSVSPNAAPVGAPITLEASGFAPNSTIDLQWEAMRGNRQQGWAPKSFPLDKITTDASGSYRRELKMPDDLGGGHALVAVVNEQRVADARVVIEPSVVQMTPRSGPAGTDLTIELKGVGWTEVDNSYAVTYDNAIMGYACGFNSAGDVTIHTKVSGAPGWHFIDFWPEFYMGHNESPWLPILPWLNIWSHPGFPKPAFHLAFQVTE